MVPPALDAEEAVVKLEPEEVRRTPKEVPRGVRRRRSGDARKPRRARSAPAEGLVTPLRLGRSRDQLPAVQGRPVLGGPDRARRLEELKTTYILNKLAHGTKLGYQKGWEQWQLFRAQQGKPLFLDGHTHVARRVDEEDLLAYIVHWAANMGKSDATIKQKLFAVRYMHLTAGYSDPLLWRPRVWAALAGIAKDRDPVKRKFPATPRMLLWVKRHLHNEAGLGAADAAALWAAFAIGFFFMLRASEYLVQPDKHWSRERVIHGSDIVPRFEGCDSRSFSEAHEVVLYIKGSKTDQYNVGCTRNQFESNEELCPVQAMRDFERHFPERLRGTERESPIFRYQGGGWIRREHIQHYLELAAVALNIDPLRMGSHSLRIGGATSMYHSVKDLSRVQRFGRWTSNCFHDYLWENHEGVRNLARRMATDFTELTAPK